MRSLTFILIILLGMSVTASPQTFTVVDSFRCPNGTPFGLAGGEGCLWHSVRSADLIYKLDPLNCSVIDSFQPPLNDPAGLAWDGDYLWCANWSGGMIYQLDVNSVTVVNSFYSPYGSPFGLAWDGEFLWCAEVGSGTICKLDPQNGNILFSFAVPSFPMGLAWQDGYLWVSIGNVSIIQYEASSGNIVNSFNAPGPSSRGLAWFNGYLWNCDNGTHKIYKIDIGYSGADGGEEIKPEKFTLRQNYPNPFNAATTISYSLPSKSEISLSIFNLLGQRVELLFEGVQNPGEHAFIWDASGFPSGVYFARLEMAERTGNIKMVLLK